MKLYIVLSPGILNMGGSQMYTRNKLKYLENLSYEVNLFHSGIKNGNVLINDLLQYEHNRVFYLNYPAYLFKKRTQEKVISLICKQIQKQYDELIIESHSTASATWGELIAEKTKGKHIIYLLSESNSIRNRSIYNFFRFKLERRELVGIQQKSIPILFKNWQEIDNNRSYHMSAACANVVEDVPYPILSEIPRSDFTIGSIGRLNKLFLIHIMDDIIDFINNHEEKSFSIIFIGGEPSNSNSEKKIKDKFKNISNVSLFFTGYIYPIPKELVVVPQVYLSTAGSCYVSNSFGIPTIPIDYNDHKPIGVLNKTTKNVIYRDMEPQVELKILLNDILIKGLYRSEELIESEESQINFSEHLKFVLYSKSSKFYFDINSSYFSLIDWVEKLALIFLGDNLYRSLSMKFWPIWHKIRK
ncbi:glycosyltransferase family 4 protein [Flavobacteriaceae bacterium]|nr:glycosyltransferase family 4 protein [Flavobacteriaceae bacterium]